MQTAATILCALHTNTVDISISSPVATAWIHQNPNHHVVPAFAVCAGCKSCATGWHVLRVEGVNSLKNSILMQFAREPVCGAVKTRMQPALTPEQSLVLHRLLTRRVHAILRVSQLAPIEVWVAGTVECDLFQDMQKQGATLHAQIGQNLGEKMMQAIGEGLQRAGKVVLVGSDCIGLTSDYLRAAFSALDNHQVVFGPAIDGGYVLIGMSEKTVDVFDAIPWGSDRVMELSRERCTELDVKWKELDALPDIDRPEDLDRISSFREGKDLLSEWFG